MPEWMWGNPYSSVQRVAKRLRMRAGLIYALVTILVLLAALDFSGGHWRTAVASLCLAAANGLLFST
jgi:hypothetical protein